MMVCSDVSDDGKMLLLTMAKEGQPEIYTYNIQSKKYKRETVYGGIDVNGQFLDNNTIVFVSSRLGYPNIFSKNLRTGEIEQRLFYGRNNSSCSTHGEYIVYKARETSASFGYNTFNIHLISTKTDFIRRLTAIGVNEYPKFSRDGDAVIFVKTYKGQHSIGVVRLNHNKTFLFPIRNGKFQSIDW
jgi:TolB protein